MKIQRLKTNKKIAIIILLILAILIGTATVYATSGSLFGWNPLNILTKDSPTNEQIETGQQIKENSLENNEGKGGSDQPVKPVTNEAGKQKIEVDIVSVNRVDATIKASVLVSTLDQNGTCTLVVTDKNNQTLYTTSVGTQAMPTTSTCKGFDIPTDNIPNDSYVLSVSYESGIMYGTAIYESK
jgi:hypothetical protein